MTLARLGANYLSFCGADFRLGDILGFIATHLTNPRLSITVTITFRDEPRLFELLLRTEEAEKTGQVDGRRMSIQEAVSEADEYMVESFDG